MEWLAYGGKHKQAPACSKRTWALQNWKVGKWAYTAIIMRRKQNKAKTGRQNHPLMYLYKTTTSCSVAALAMIL